MQECGRNHSFLCEWWSAGSLPAQGEWVEIRTSNVSSHSTRTTCTGEGRPRVFRLCGYDAAPLAVSGNGAQSASEVSGRKRDMAAGTSIRFLRRTIYTNLPLNYDSPCGLICAILRQRPWRTAASLRPSLRLTNHSHNSLYGFNGRFVLPQCTCSFWHRSA